MGVSALTTPPFVNRYATGTGGQITEAQWVQQMKLKADNGQLRGGDYAQTLQLFPQNRALQQAMHKAAVQGLPFNYTNAPSSVPEGEVYTNPDGSQGISFTQPEGDMHDDLSWMDPKLRDIRNRTTYGNVNLNLADANYARTIGDNALASAILKAISGQPFEYTWAPKPVPTTPAPPPQPEMNPQVIWYDKDVWAKNPTLKYLNNDWTENAFMTPTSRASFDPATGTTIQAAGSINAKNWQDINNDPVRRAAMQSLYSRHNRSWEKEGIDAITNSPTGNASAYSKTY